jgi:hypothetical protein
MDDEPEWLAGAGEMTRQMYRYWKSKCRDTALPKRADIDPTELPPRFLPCLLIVEAVPDERRYVYRLVGTREVDVRRRDPTGRSVIDAFFGSTLEKTLDRYDSVVKSRTPVFNPNPYRTYDDRYIREENLYLPLSDDGERVNRILVFSTGKPGAH